MALPMEIGAVTQTRNRKLWRATFKHKQKPRKKDESNKFETEIYMVNLLGLVCTRTRNQSVASLACRLTYENGDY